MPLAVAILTLLARPGLTFQDEAKAAAIKSLDLDWICQEVEWLRKQLCRTATATVSNGRPGTPSDTSPTPEERAKEFLAEVVLCHNDLLSGNVLHADGWNRVQVGGGADCKDETPIRSCCPCLGLRPCIWLCRSASSGYADLKQKWNLPLHTWGH